MQRYLTLSWLLSRVKRSILSTSQNQTEALPTNALDAALSAISGPVKLNTITKSGADWDNFKETSGLGAELEQAAKDGFLAKKDFLERVDQRLFEKERDLRAEQRELAR